MHNKLHLFANLGKESMEEAQSFSVLNIVDIEILSYLCGIKIFIS